MSSTEHNAVMVAFNIVGAKKQEHLIRGRVLYMAAKALPFLPYTIDRVAVCEQSASFDHGLLVTFSGNRTVYFDGSWLYDHREDCGNFVLDEDDPDM